MTGAERKMLEISLGEIERSATKLEEVCHGDAVTDAQIDALASAVAAQSDAIARLIRWAIGSRPPGQTDDPHRWCR